MHSKYSKDVYNTTYDEELAREFEPIVYDPYQYGRDNNPALYFRIVESAFVKCIQYFYYWDEQNCKKDYVISEPNTVGSLFGILFAIVESIVSYLVITTFPEIFSIPIWAQYLLTFIAFIVGLLVGNKYHNEINDIVFFQRTFGFLVGRFFTHKYDFEPILIFINNSKVEKVVISGKGDLDSTPHRNDIYVNQSYHNEGKSIFSFSILGDNQDRVSQTEFKEFRLEELESEKCRPKFALVTCYHGFTAKKDYYGELVFSTNEVRKFELKELSDIVLDHWYQIGFGHEVSDPFSFPYIKFAGEVNTGRTSILSFLDAISMIMKGLIAIKKSIINFQKHAEPA